MFDRAEIDSAEYMSSLWQTTADASGAHPPPQDEEQWRKCADEPHLPHSSGAWRRVMPPTRHQAPPSTRHGAPARSTAHRFPKVVYPIANSRFEVDSHYRVLSVVGQGAQGIICDAIDSRARAGGRVRAPRHTACAGAGACARPATLLYPVGSGEEARACA